MWQQNVGIRMTRTLINTIPKRIVVTEDLWEQRDKEELARITYPVRKGDESHYPFHFTDGLTFWRVLTDYKSKKLLSFCIYLTSRY